MKLIIAIVSNDDSAAVADKLTSEGFMATRLATTGGYLKAGNTTFIVGTQAIGAAPWSFHGQVQIVF